MREGAKKRLAGAVVVVALAVIFVPMLFEENPPTSTTTESLPAEPAVEDRQIAQPAEPSEDTSATSMASESEPPPLPAPGASEGSAGDPRFADGNAEEDYANSGQPGQLSFSDDTGEPAVPRIQPAQDRYADEDRPRETARPSRPPRAEERAAAAPRPAPQPKRGAETPKPESPRAAEGKSRWVIQVASLSASEAAAAMQQKLKSAGYAAYVEKAEVRGKTFYRVRVGPNSDRAGAERTAAMLRQQQKLDTLIQRQAER